MLPASVNYILKMNKILYIEKLHMLSLSCGCRSITAELSQCGRLYEHPVNSAPNCRYSLNSTHDNTCNWLIND